MSRRNPSLLEVMRRRHRKTHPHCTYGDEPHFVPPSLGDPGFYLCECLPRPDPDEHCPDCGRLLSCVGSCHHCEDRRSR